MSSRIRKTAIAIVVLTCFQAATTYAQGKSAAPIKVGAISSLTSAAAFPDSIKAAKAYFDSINAEGGIHGRKLVLIAADDKGDPKIANEAARRIVERENVVAMVGSASTVECGANGAYYTSQRIVSIQGTGVDTACFNSPNISPVNTGPYVGLAAALQFASEIRGRRKICALLMDIPGMRAGNEEAIGTWKQHYRKELHHHDPAYPPGTPTASYAKKILDAQCDAIVFNGIEPWVIEWIKYIKAAGGGSIDWLFLTPAYTSDVARKAGADVEGIYAMSEFLPWSSRALDLTDWRETMNRSKVPLTSFSQGGYLAAQIFVSVLRRIPGEINRESVLAAFRGLDRYESPLIGTPYSFGMGQRHNSNHAIIPMVLRDGGWRVAHPDWIIVPTK